MKYVRNVRNILPGQWCQCFRYHLTWHAFVEIRDSIRTVVHHTGDVKMSPMFSVNKLLQKKLQRSDNLVFKVKFSTQISLNYLLCPERFTWTVIHNYLEENCCSTRSSWPNKTKKNGYYTADSARGQYEAFWLATRAGERALDHPRKKNSANVYPSWSHVWSNNTHLFN